MPEIRTHARASPSPERGAQTPTLVLWDPRRPRAGDGHTPQPPLGEVHASPAPLDLERPGSPIPGQRENLSVLSLLGTSLAVWCCPDSRRCHGIAYKQEILRPRNRDSEPALPAAQRLQHLQGGRLRLLSEREVRVQFVFL